MGKHNTEGWQLRMVPPEAEAIGVAPSTAIGMGSPIPIAFCHPTIASREDPRRPDHFLVLLLNLLWFGIPPPSIRQERATFVRLLHPLIASGLDITGACICPFPLAPNHRSKDRLALICDVLGCLLAHSTTRPSSHDDSAC